MTTRHLTRQILRPVAGLALAAAVAVPAAVGASADVPDTPSPACTSSANSYEIGCRSLPGHADGWFLGTTENPASAPTPVRIDQRYQ